MKKTSLLLIVMLIFTLGACKKDKGTSDEFSTATVAEHKQNIQADAANVSDRLNRMLNLQAFSVLEEFMELDPFGSEDTYRVEGALKSVVAYEDEDFLDYFDDALSFQDWFDNESGNYIYNDYTEEWDKTPSSSELSYAYTSQEYGEVKIKISNFKTSKVNNESLPFVADLLSSAIGEVIVDGTTLMKITFGASYDKEGLPSSINLGYEVENYKMNGKVYRNNSSAGLEFSLKEGKENIISANVSSEGNFELSEIMTEYASDDDILESDILRSGNLKIAVGNLQLDGNANFKKIAEASEKYAEGTDTPENLAIGRAEVMNNNIKVFFRYHDSGKVIAKGDFYPEYDEYDGWHVNMRMLFSDETYMDESYLREGFADYITFISRLFEKIDSYYVDDRYLR